MIFKLKLQTRNNRGIKRTGFQRRSQRKLAVADGQFLNENFKGFKGFNIDDSDIDVRNKNINILRSKLSQSVTVNMNSDGDVTQNDTENYMSNVEEENQLEIDEVLHLKTSGEFHISYFYFFLFNHAR